MMPYSEKVLLSIDIREHFAPDDRHNNKKKMDDWDLIWNTMFTIYYYNNTINLNTTGENNNTETKSNSVYIDFHSSSLGNSD